MRYTVIAHSDCGGGSCPTIYKDETEAKDVIVQGYVVPADEAASLGVPAGETLVRVPRALLDQVRHG